ncbi:hypothetical protein ACFB49_33820 [Sphingomonas sp. DBB INV C78]|uniref:hypothetical protein n=1 Tax=Sphingomonas sp. DBB INV C78 TaxID=3349434 RepID=UPI0036D381C5
MTRRQKLKVYRTPIGFHDAYVAAPSQKAALAAWGSDNNLFAQGLAEEVKDPELMAELLASPGAVIRRSRDSSQEQLAAIGRASPRSRCPEQRVRTRPAPEKERPVEKAALQQKARPTSRPRSAVPPRPSRAAVEAAEAALAESERLHAEERRELARRQAELAAAKRTLERRQGAEHARLERAVEKARERYRQALSNWSKKG